MATPTWENAYFFLRRYEEADRAYEQAIKLTEKDSLLWWNLGDGYYWTPGKRSQSVAAYKQGIAIAEEELHVNPNNSSSYGVLAVCYAMLGERKPALDALRRGLRLSPTDQLLFYQGALVYNQFGQSQEALDWLKKAVAAGWPRLSPFETTLTSTRLWANPRSRELLREKITLSFTRRRYKMGYPRTRTQSRQSRCHRQDWPG